MASKINSKGFTIVELLIVIVVIGILAVLALNTIGGAQARARDTERKADIRALHKGLEIYFTDNEAYPEVASINSTDFVGLDTSSLSDPEGVPINDTGSDYTYSASSCSGSSCSDYTLQAILEEDDPYIVSSIN